MDDNNRKFDKRNLIFIAIGIGILFGIIYKVGAENIIDTLYSLYKNHPDTLVLCFSLFLSANLIRLSRWAILYRDVSATNAMKIWLIGQSVNELAPFGTGEITRAYIAKKRLGIRIRKTLVAMAIERTADITFLGVMAVACAILVLSEIAIIPILIIIFILLGIVYSMLFFPSNLDRLIPLVKWFQTRKNKSLKKIGKRGLYWLSALKKSLYQQKKRKYVLIIALALTVLIWSIEAIGYFLLLTTLGYDVLFQYVLIIISASWIIGVLSFLPGGIGMREGTFTVLIGTLKVPSADAIIIALIYRGIAYIILGTGSLISMLTLPRKSKKSSEK